MSIYKTLSSKGVTRRGFIKGAGAIAGGAAAALTVPASVRSAFAQGDDVIRVGFIGPRSGPLGVFGEGDAFLVEQFNSHMADGVQVGDKRYGIQLVLADTQSDPVRASQVAKDLINGEAVDLMLASSTPETVNPVADACEADEFMRAHPATVEITGGRFGSARVSSDHPLPVGLASVVERVTGRRPALLGEPYGADMQMFVNHGDTPCVIFGPGDIRVAHSADEYVPLDEVETCARVLAEWVRTEIGGGQSPREGREVSS